MTKLIPIYDTKAILNSWQHFREGLQRVEDVSCGDVNETTLLNDILAGHLLLWAGFREGKHVGLLITQTQNIPTIGKQLWVIQVYIKPDAPKETFMEGLAQLEKHAWEEGYKTIRMQTTRDKGFAKKLGDTWKQGYIEFHKEV